MRQTHAPEPDRSLAWISNPSNWIHWMGYAVPLKKANGASLEREDLAVAIILPDNTYKLRVGKTICEPPQPDDVWIPTTPQAIIAHGWLVD